MTDKKNSGKKQLAEMEAKIAGPNPDFANSLEQCKEELSTAFLNFKDLRDRCAINITEKSSVDNQQVFYFRPETFLLDDTEKQRQYRDSLLKKIAGVPKPEPITYLGDDIHRNFSMVVADRSTPALTKDTLAEFFYRRHYNL
jgi:hypothetical protein